MSESRAAFDRFVRRNKLPESERFVQWAIWKAGASFQRKIRNKKVRK